MYRIKKLNTPYPRAWGLGWILPLFLHPNGSKKFDYIHVMKKQIWEKKIPHKVFPAKASRG